MNPITSEPGVVELSRQEGREMLDEFEAAYDAGTLDLDQPVVEHLVMLLPFAR